MQETLEIHVQSLGQEDPLEKEMAKYSCLRNAMDRGVWRAIVHGAAESDMTKHAKARVVAFFSCLSLFPPF